MIFAPPGCSRRRVSVHACGTDEYTWQEISYVVHLSMHDDPAAVCTGMLCDCLSGNQRHQDSMVRTCGVQFSTWTKRSCADQQGVHTTGVRPGPRAERTSGGGLTRPHSTLSPNTLSGTATGKHLYVHTFACCSAFNRDLASRFA